MTDRHSGYLVTLEEDKREGNAETIINAIKQLKGVIKVEPVSGEVSNQIAKTRAKQEIREQIWDAVNKY